MKNCNVTIMTGALKDGELECESRSEGVGLGQEPRECFPEKEAIELRSEDWEEEGYNPRKREQHVQSLESDIA